MEDVVNHPSHYTSGKIEVIDFIEDQKLNYHLGNTIKYICRAGKKDPNKIVEDLQKAQWYLNREIERLKNVIPENQTALFEPVNFKPYVIISKGTYGID